MWWIDAISVFHAEVSEFESWSGMAWHGHMSSAHDIPIFFSFIPYFFPLSHILGMFSNMFLLSFAVQLFLCSHISRSALFFIIFCVIVSVTFYFVSDECILWNFQETIIKNYENVKKSFFKKNVHLITG